MGDIEQDDLHIRIPTELKKAFQEIVKEQYTTMSALLIAWIAEYLNDTKKI